MNKQNKIKILDNLIIDVQGLKYSKEFESQKHMINQTKSFLNKEMIPADRMRWESEINKIDWKPSLIRNSNPSIDIIQKSWEKGKKEFLDILMAIKNEIMLYEKGETVDIDPPFYESMKKTNEIEKKSKNNEPIIFLSHSSKDKKYGDSLERFIVGLGIEDNQLIYTSHSRHKIPLGKNIYEYLKENIQDNTYMIILWSEDYLNSIPCICELGAGWIVKNEYISVFTPGFNMNDQRYTICPTDSKKIGIVLDGDQLRTNMIELKDDISRIFDLKINEKKTQSLIDQFISEINDVEMMTTIPVHLVDAHKE